MEEANTIDFGFPSILRSAVLLVNCPVPHLTHGQGLQYLYPGYLQQYLMKWYFYLVNFLRLMNLIFLSVFEAEQSWKINLSKRGLLRISKKRSWRWSDGLRPGEDKIIFAPFQKRPWRVWIKMKLLVNWLIVTPLVRGLRLSK